MKYDAELNVVSTQKVEEHHVPSDMKERIKGDYYYVSGYIYGDKKGRFRDGSLIRTSMVVKETKKYIHTLNTTYKKV